MTVLYEIIELEDTSSPKLRIWKAWHIIVYAFIAVLGIVNYTCLENTKQFVGNHCVFYPNKLAFHLVEIELPPEKRTVGKESQVNNEREKAQESNGTVAPANSNDDLSVIAQEYPLINASAHADAQISKDNKTVEKSERERRDVVYRNDTKDFEITIEADNVTVLIENKTHRLMLDIINTYFLKDSECQYAEFIPLLSTIFAMVWMILYMMCPGEGRQTSGLQEPWRILAPALIFAMILFCVTASSLAQTNGGIQAFCAAFYNYTNTTACSAVGQYLESDSSWSFGLTATMTRVASGAVLAGWACACALVLVRCVLAPDFAIKRTAVLLTKDPEKKLTPYLKKSLPRASPRVVPPPPATPDDISVKSEPTFTSHVVTATVETNDNSDSLEEFMELKNILPIDKNVV